MGTFFHCSAILLLFRKQNNQFFIFKIFGKYRFPPKMSKMLTTGLTDFRYEIVFGKASKIGKDYSSQYACLCRVYEHRRNFLKIWQVYRH